MVEFIHLPGIGNSGKTHWQSRWENGNVAIRRFNPTSWNRPDLADWIAALEQAVGEARVPPVLVAHSLACLLVAHWQQASALPVKGAFLVAVPDPQSAVFPAEAAGFRDPPQSRFRFPSLIVASTDDPYGSLAYMRARANQWDSELHIIGAAGHINGQSGLGDWPEGLTILEDFSSRAFP